MARGLNKVLLIGNLGNDPEIKYSQSGNAIANISIATTEGRKNANGEWEDYTEWHRVVMFGKLAETCKDYLRKGSKVFIEGRIQTRSWEDKDGKKNYMTEVVGASMLMLDSKGSDSSMNTASSDSGSGNESRQSSNMPNEEDDLPF
ncbi:single-stranded DNA-binding protein [Candidatus Latescibacterota bacterium]